MVEAKLSGDPVITVLAVDDDAGVLDVLANILRAAGYRVLTADGGRSALEAYRAYRAPVDLLLSDVEMPDLSGPVVAGLLRARQPGLPVLYVSGYHDTATLQRVAGGDNFLLLAKPFTPEGLLRGVRKSLDPRSTASAA